MKESEIQIAQKLDEAAATARAIHQVAEINSIELESAYNIQRLSIAEREKRGEKIVGYKLGFTSKAKMEQMGVHDLIWGILTDTMEIPNGGKLSIQKFIHPRSEPEIAFLVGKDFNQTLTLENCADYIERSAAAIEIIDSRYENFKFSLEDVVADNCSSSAFVFRRLESHSENIAHLHMQMYFNEELKQEGSSFEILENPLQSVVELSRLSKAMGIQVKKGDVILAGASTQAEFLKENIEVKVAVEKLGTVHFSVVS